jgi:hypothetical protein
LRTPVTLQGFFKNSLKTVTEKVTVKLTVDLVDIVDMFILDELSGCNVLIGRNVTERSDLMYSRIGETLTFESAFINENFCKFKFDADSHYNELTALLGKYKLCVASNFKELGKVDGYEMVINLNDNKSIQSLPSPTLVGEDGILTGGFLI